MATTKVFTAIWNANTLTASTADETSTLGKTIDVGYGAALHIKITNGATGPTIAAQCQIQVSGDDSEYYDLGGPLVGNTDNNGVESWGGIDIPIGVEFIRLVAGSNTGQDVTIDADISQVTAIS